MNPELKNILNNENLPNYMHPFTSLSAADTREDIFSRAKALKDVGIRSMDLMWTSNPPEKMMSLSLFDTPEYWEKISYVVEACREYGMTFMIQDASPFPTGEAEGWFRKPEYAHLNKQYLAERHLDVLGPVCDAQFNVSALVGAVRDPVAGLNMLGGPMDLVPYPADQLVALVAMERVDGIYNYEDAVDLTDMVEDGLLYWNIPAGQWRLFAVYCTYHGGRKHYMNLLDKDSVRLLTESLHTPHYKHLKDEIGKTWLGFFYDETEVGNAEGYIFDATIGKSNSAIGENPIYPWSKDMTAECSEKMGADYRKMLPLLWYQDQNAYHHVRFRYMDIISRLIQENYNGQIYRWCKDRGILYIGHNLEDENSHMRLACGPVHYFRMQAHQDMAGVDLIGSQIMPKKDFTSCWYGSVDGDGEFYHYGLAKLASSAGHISPEKQKKSFCELLAVYGNQTGLKLRKFIMDHLLVNGIGNMIQADPYAVTFSQESNLQVNTYLNRMCHLLNHTDPIIKTAILYNNAGEWYQGDYMPFQKPAAVLAKAQISYDIVPDDVFEDAQLYHSDFTDGLVINGNRYEALVIPGTQAIAKATADFVVQAQKTGFPVFFVGTKPNRIAETGEPWSAEYGDEIALDALEKHLRQVLHCDLLVKSHAPWLRYNHFRDHGGHYYFLHNEGDAETFQIKLCAQGALYRIDVENCRVTRLPAVEESGMLSLTLPMAEFEAVLLYSGDLDAEYTVEKPMQRSVELKAPWMVSLNGQVPILLEQLKNLCGKDMFPRHGGIAVYTTEVTFDEIPDMIDLGAVEEACQLLINGIPVGRCVSAPYRFAVRDHVVQGKNTLMVVVESNFAHAKVEGLMALAASLLGDTYNVRRPCGMLGPVCTQYF